MKKLSLFLLFFLSACKTSYEVSAIERTHFDSFLVKKNLRKWREHPSFGSGIAYSRFHRSFVLLSDGVKVKKKKYSYVLGSLSTISLGVPVRVAGIHSKRHYDLEDIAFDAEGNLWIADESGQSLVRFSYPDLKKKQTLKAGKELPRRYKDIQDGRGFEGVAVASDGMLTAAVQSSLLASGRAEKESFIRIISIEPDSKQFFEFKYMPEHATADTKLGALTFVSEPAVYAVLEHGVAENGLPFASIFLITLDRSHRTEATPEVKKEQVVDLIARGVESTKPEGLEYVSDEHAFYLTSDPDEMQSTSIVKIQLKRGFAQKVKSAFRYYRSRF